MVSKISSLDDYVNIERELEEKISSWDDQLLHKLQQITFALIGPDGASPANLPRIISLIEENDFKILDFNIYTPLTENKIESLYKYHVPDAIKSRIEFKQSSCDYRNYCPYMKMVPTRNWRLLRRRFEMGASIALLINGNPSKDVVREFKNLKGPTDPFHSEKGQIRDNTDNPVNSFIHSSDDTVSVLRESLIFFDEARIKQALQVIQGYNFSTFKKIMNVLLPDPQEYRFLIVALRLRIRIALCLHRLTGNNELLDFYFSFYDEAIELKTGKVMLRRFSELLVEEQEWFVRGINQHENDESLHQIYGMLQILSLKEAFRNFDSTMYKAGLTQLGIPCNEQELLLLESGMWYFRE